MSLGLTLGELDASNRATALDQLALERRQRDLEFFSGATAIAPMALDDELHVAVNATHQPRAC